LSKDEQQQMTTPHPSSHQASRPSVHQGPRPSAKEDARTIFHQALASCSIPAAFARKLESLPHADDACVIAVGKAALPMLDALSARVSIKAGICCAPVLPASPLPGITYFTGGHPLPNEDSFRSAQAALDLLRNRPSGLVYFLISGGGSAMFELPLEPTVSLSETQSLYKTLVGCGAAIAEINCVRKHFSAVKGGRLAAAAPDRFSVLVSDVAPRHLDALASGPTLEDSSTVEQCRQIIEQYQLQPQFTPAVRAFFADPDLPETPNLSNAPVEVLLSSDDLADAARRQAEAMGYTVVIDNTCDDWDYADAARYLLQRFCDLRLRHKKLCLLSTGEVTVKLGREHGEGGRNQQFALACALALDDHTVILSAGSDGIDGTSPAAGAIVDQTTVQRCQAKGIDAAQALARFDAYPVFAALGDVLVTGPTHNNLRDLRILLSTE
jgi:glycerate 2-kinase